MCGIFGLVYYGPVINKDFDRLLEVLAISASCRGEDATGIAFVNKEGNVIVKKQPVAAKDFKINTPNGTRAYIGHTRQATQGSEKRNFNNHPFKGVSKDTAFALAHNGIIGNDVELRGQLGISKTKIETDTYIAVQVLEKLNQGITYKSLGDMATLMEGQYAFSVIDDKQNIWLVKGSNPISILNIPDENLIIYASTPEIILNALMYSEYVEVLIDQFRVGSHSTGAYLVDELVAGDIVKIDVKGNIDFGQFKYTDTTWAAYSYSGYGCYGGTYNKYYGQKFPLGEDAKDEAEDLTPAEKKFYGLNESLKRRFDSFDFDEEDIMDMIRSGEITEEDVIAAGYNVQWFREYKAELEGIDKEIDREVAEQEAKEASKKSVQGTQNEGIPKTDKGSGVVDGKPSPFLKDVLTWDKTGRPLDKNYTVILFDNMGRRIHADGKLWYLKDTIEDIEKNGGNDIKNQEKKPILPSSSDGVMVSSQKKKDSVSTTSKPTAVVIPGGVILNQKTITELTSGRSTGQVRAASSSSKKELKSCQQAQASILLGSVKSSTKTEKLNGSTTKGKSCQPHGQQDQRTGSKPELQLKAVLVDYLETLTRAGEIASQLDIDEYKNKRIREEVM